MHNYKTLISLSMLFTLISLAGTAIFAQEVSDQWYAEMEEKRAETVRSLWQS